MISSAGKLGQVDTAQPKLFHVYEPLHLICFTVCGQERLWTCLFVGQEPAFPLTVLLHEELSVLQHREDSTREQQGWGLLENCPSRSKPLVSTA